MREAHRESDSRSSHHSLALGIELHIETQSEFATVDSGDCVALTELYSAYCCCAVGRNAPKRTACVRFNILDATSKHICMCESAAWREGKHKSNNDRRTLNTQQLYRCAVSQFLLCWETILAQKRVNRPHETLTDESNLCTSFLY
jgi:hypothetical protein